MSGETKERILNAALTLSLMGAAFRLGWEEGRRAMLLWILEVS